MRTALTTFAAFASAALIALMPTATFAQSAPTTTSPAEGTPNDAPNSPTGWYIFHSDDAFHIRTHGPAAAHDFDGVLHTRGTFENVSVLRLEDGDRAEVTNGGHDLVIHFHTFDGIDGVNFTIRDANSLRLNLKLDDHSAPLDKIFIGPLGVHPKRNPFHLSV